MRLNDFYNQILRDSRRGHPTIREAAGDYRRSLESELDVYRPR